MEHAYTDGGNDGGGDGGREGGGGVLGVLATKASKKAFGHGKVGDP